MRENTTIDAKGPAAPGAGPRELAGLEGTCVSVYLAGHKAGSGSRPMKVRLRAMLGEAERMLDRQGVLPTDREDLLAPMKARAEDADLAAGRGDGLAMFRTSRRLEEISLPWEVEDLVAVEGRPLLTPLAHARDSHREFLLLAVSKKHTRLLECSPSTQKVLGLPAGVPHSLEEFGGFDRPDHTRGRTGGGTQFVLDTFAEKERQYLHDFCRAIERGLQPLLEQRGLPLVLVGATAELSVYREVNRYALLGAEAVEGSPDAGWTDAELAAKGRLAMQAWQPAAAQHAGELYLRAGPAKKSVEINEILRAAAAGRVLHLVLAGRTPVDQTGDVERILGRVPPSGSRRGAHDHLANAAAVETWRHSGNVWCVDEPLDGSAVAAVYRW